MKKSDILKVLAFFMFLYVGQSGRAQNAVSDTTRAPKTERVKFSGLKQSVYTEMEAFSNFTPGQPLGMSWSPLCVIKPTVTFNDKFSVSAITTQMFQNVVTQDFKPIMHDMFLNMNLKTNKVNVSLDAGYLTTLNYQGMVANRMPIQLFFQNAVLVHSGHYFPMAVIGGVNNDRFAVRGGYAEYGDKLSLSGGGDVVFAGEFFGKNFKVGTLWMLNQGKCVGDLQAVYKNGKHTAFIEFVGIGSNEFALHAMYALKVSDNGEVVLNGEKQFKNVGLEHLSVMALHKCGAYVALGVSNYDVLKPLDKNMLFVGLGFRGQLFQREN